MHPAASVPPSREEGKPAFRARRLRVFGLFTPKQIIDHTEGGRDLAFVY
jgi:hypothetical protein